VKQTIRKTACQFLNFGLRQTAVICVLGLLASCTSIREVEVHEPTLEITPNNLIAAALKLYLKPSRDERLNNMIGWYWKSGFFGPKYYKVVIGNELIDFLNFQATAQLTAKGVNAQPIQVGTAADDTALVLQLTLISAQTSPFLSFSPFAANAEIESLVTDARGHQVALRSYAAYIPSKSFAERSQEPTTKVFQKTFGAGWAQEQLANVNEAITRAVTNMIADESFMASITPTRVSGSKSPLAAPTARPTTQPQIQ